MFEFKLPDLGEGVHEGQVVNVLVNEGDAIAEYQPMLEVETDKAAVEIPSPRTGVVAKIHIKAGDIIKVGQVLVTIDDAAGPAASRKATPAVEPARAAAPAAEALPARPASGKPAASPAPPPAPAVRPSSAPPGAPSVTPEPPRDMPVPAAASGDEPVPAAPSVRKLARELNVDLQKVRPTGPGGRIMREDVERFAAAQSDAEAAVVVAPPMKLAAGRAEVPSFDQPGAVRREAATQIRKTIARQMTRAWQNVPRVTHGDKADVTDLERNRKAFNESLKPGDAKLTMTTLVMKAVAAALREHPRLNCSYDAETEEIIYKDFVNIGVAVDTPRGLVVPVLRDADKKTLPQLAAELAGIGERARTAKFEIAELRGATFTITNVGALGGQFFTPMVNFPEVAILGLGQARMEPAVREGQIVPRLLLPIALSFDHRIVDGADGARFVNQVIRSIENPLRLISLA